MDALTAIATTHGLAVLSSELKEKVTKYGLIGATTHDSGTTETFHTGKIHSSYYDESGVLTFQVELPIERDFGKYLYAISVADDNNKIVAKVDAPKIALASGIGGMLSIKVAVTGEPGQVVFKANDYISTAELDQFYFTSTAALSEAVIRLQTEQCRQKEEVNMLKQKMGI